MYATVFFSVGITFMFVILNLDYVLGNPNAVSMPHDEKLFYLGTIGLSWLATCIVRDIKS